MKPPKAQAVRVADVAVIGPLMVWGGLMLAAEHPVRGGALALLGGATVAYNLENYMKLWRPEGAIKGGI